MKENEQEWREIKKILAERFFQNLVKNGRVFILVILSVMYLHIFFFFLVKNTLLFEEKATLIFEIF